MSKFLVGKFQFCSPYFYCLSLSLCVKTSGLSTRICVQFSSLEIYLFYSCVQKLWTLGPSKNKSWSESTMLPICGINFASLVISCPFGVRILPLLSVFFGNHTLGGGVYIIPLSRSSSHGVHTFLLVYFLP